MNKFIVIAIALVCVVLIYRSFGGGKIGVGEQLPDVPLVYLGGASESKGKPMLLEYWATWCPPCRESIPHLNELNEKYKSQGLTVLGVTEEPAAVVRKFQKEVPMKYAVAMDTGGRLAKKLGIRGIPAAFLVDKKGTIVWRGHPMQLTEAEIKKVL